MLKDGIPEDEKKEIEYVFTESWFWSLSRSSIWKYSDILSNKD